MLPEKQFLRIKTDLTPESSVFMMNSMRPPAFQPIIMMKRNLIPSTAFLAALVFVACDGGKKQDHPRDVSVPSEQAVPKTPGVGLYRYFPLLFAHFPIRKRKGFTGGPDTISNRPSFRQNRMKRNIVVITQFPARGIYFYGSSAVGSNPSTSRGTLPVYSPASK